MLAASPLIQEDLTIHKLADLLNQCIKMSGCSQRGLARRFGSSEQLVNILKYRTRMHVGTVLHLLTCMQLDIADFVREPVTILVSHHLDSFIRSLPRKWARGRRAGREPIQSTPTDLLHEAQALLEAAAAEEYPPSLNALARRAYVSSSSLWCRYPDLCQLVSDKRAVFTQSEEVRRVLIEATHGEKPPPSLQALASRLKTCTETLHKYYPDEVAAFKVQRAAWYVVDLEKKLQLFMEMDPPLSITEVANRLGRSTWYLKNNNPHLYEAIMRRYTEYQHTRTREREQQRIAAVRDAVLRLHRAGHFPRQTKVAAIVRANRWAILTEPERRAFEEIMRELGLSKR
jgi:AcrR family transcriptional regulator